MRPIDTNQVSARITPLAVTTQKHYLSIDDKFILNELRKSNPQSIEHLFDQYYQLLCNRCYQIVRDPGYAEDIVQELFLTIWRKRTTINIKSSLKGYLMRSATNRSLNHIRDNNKRIQEIEIDIQDDTCTVQHLLEYSDTKNRLDIYIDLLPPKCRAVFVMSRFENLKYREIAEILNISVKTVENHISMALAFLKSKYAVIKEVA